MKHLLIILSIFLFSCSETIYPEGELRLTKAYVGRVESIHQYDNVCIILTDKAVIKVKEQPDIPEGTRCYIRIDYTLFDYHPQIARQLDRQYLIWGDNEYLLINRIRL